MAFLDTLNICCAEYTGGYYHDGTKIPFPYYYGGKNTPSEIKSTIQAWIGSSTKTATEVKTYVNGNPSKTGIDCSGLVYYALNEATSGAVRSFFEDKLKLPGQLVYRHGITALNLTNSSYGTQITAAKDVKPGCIIRFDDGKHVIVIHSVNKNSAGVVTSIVYAHSNDDEGPHHATITIGDQSKDLNHSSQTWNDVAYSDSYAKSKYNYTLLLEPVKSFV